LKRNFPFYKQPDSKDCGPTCLRIIAKYYGKLISLKEIREISETTREGSSLLKLSEAAESMGFKTIGAKLNFEKLKHSPLPLIVHWDKQHFVVVYRIKKDVVYISDPAYGLIHYSKAEFISRWIGNNADEQTKEGITLLLEPTPVFRKMKWEDKEKRSLTFLFKYLFNYKNLIAQLAIGLLVGSLLQLIFPFLTQSIVDFGIQNQDINFIYLVLFAQIMLFLGRMSVEVLRSWILLHLTTRINISLVSDFFIKLMNLPISYFDTRMTGDIMQRIGDHRRIENLLTGTTLSTLFSFFNLIVFGAVLIYYSLTIFLIFLAGSMIYLVWVLFFMKRRRELDYKRFAQLSQEQSTVIELINGMQEIKMHNAEKQKRWSWEFVQARLFQVSIQSLSLEQAQQVGSSVINELKNIFITFTSAVLVIEGNLTLGMMLALQYIIGQLNGPISELVGFVRSYQDAAISLERLNEIHDKEAIDRANQAFATDHWKEKVVLKLSTLSMTIESEWDWSQNHVLFTRVKYNNIENNLTLEPYYYQTLLLPDKHHGEVIEYLLNPMETYLISLLSKEKFVSITVVKEQVILFFENVNEGKVLIYLEEAIRFLAYSGVIFLKVYKSDLKTYENIQSR